MALVKLCNVSTSSHRGAEELRARDDVSLDIKAGEFISIIGPSGSGKPTRRHVRGCLDSLTKGTRRLDGLAMDRASLRELVRIHDEKSAFVFQFFDLLPNVELPMVTPRRMAIRDGTIARNLDSVLAGTNRTPEFAAP